jgi:hypothetical protein
MEKFRKFLKTPSDAYISTVEETNKFLEKCLLDDPQMFKAREDCRIYLACKCVISDCRGIDRNHYSAHRLYKIIQDSETLKNNINEKLCLEIERGLYFEPATFFIDRLSYSHVVEKRHLTQQCVQLTRIIKDWR